MTFSDRIKSLPMAGQMTLVAVTLGLLVVFFGGAWLLLRPRYDLLFADLRPTDAATIVAELDRTSTPYRLGDGGRSIFVPQARLDETRLAITGAELPLKGSVGFELFNKSDMGLTEFAQRINYQRALQGELARTITTLEDVDTARVHLTLTEPSIFRADRRPAEASVTITSRPGRALSNETIQGVQRLVAASVPDLDLSGVVVLDGRGALVSGGDASGADLRAPAGLRQARAIEDYYAATLLSVLEPLYPNVAVKVIVPADQWAPGAARKEAFSTWTPEERAFGLQVEVSAPGGFTDTQQDDVARLVASQIVWSAESGDRLVFPAWPGDVPTTDSSTTQNIVVPQAASAPDDEVRPAGWWVTVAVAIVVILAVLMVTSRRPRTKKLTPRQKDAYVARLRRLLSEGTGHAG